MLQTAVLPTISQHQAPKSHLNHVYFSPEWHTGEEGSSCYPVPRAEAKANFHGQAGSAERNHTKE